MRKGLPCRSRRFGMSLPIDEAAAAIGMGSDDLWSYIAEGAIPFRSIEYVDWVRLADVLALDVRLRNQRRKHSTRC